VRDGERLTNDRRFRLVKTVAPTAPAALSPFQLRFIHFLISRPFSTHSTVAMVTPAAGDYSRYQLKPSLINAGLSHFRNDVASGAPYVTQATHYSAHICIIYIYIIIYKNLLFYFVYLFRRYGIYKNGNSRLKD